MNDGGDLVVKVQSGFSMRMNLINFSHLGVDYRLIIDYSLL